MIIVNLTKGAKRQNLIIQSLKSKRDDADFEIKPGEVFDTTLYAIPDEKVKTSNELKMFAKNGWIEIMDTMPEGETELRKLFDDANAYHKESYKLEIQQSISLSHLESIIENTKDGEIKQLAMDRLVELTGDKPEESAMATGRSNHPII